MTGFHSDSPFFKSAGIGSLKTSPADTFSTMSGELNQTKACQHCKNTGIKGQDAEFNLSASTWCVCPIGEEKQRLVSETVRRSVAKGR